MKLEKPNLPDDLSVISALVNSAYRGDYSKQGWTTEADVLGGQRTDPRSLQKLIDNGEEIFVVRDERRIIASVATKTLDPETLYFGMLTVEPTLQAKGLGKFIIQEIEKLALSRGKKALVITVIHTRHELIAYYERRGFRATGKSEPFPENDPAFGIPKTKLTLLEYRKVL